jgi:XTP/dITP diphosphohydrolase
MDLLLATRNAHKTREFQEILGNEFAVQDLSAYPEIKVGPETGKTFEENAVLKAVIGSKNLPGMVIADDSGLEVNALGGAPGIFSARYAGGNATDKQNVDKLMQELARLGARTNDRRARFRCVIALARDGNLLQTFEGVAEGAIVDPPRGKKGFGYDPVFLPDGCDETFAELAAEIKNRVSHRAKAVIALREALRQREVKDAGAI